MRNHVSKPELEAWASKLQRVSVSLQFLEGDSPSDAERASSRAQLDEFAAANTARAEPQRQELQHELEERALEQDREAEAKRERESEDQFQHGRYVFMCDQPRISASGHDRTRCIRVGDHVQPRGLKNGVWAGSSGVAIVAKLSYVGAGDERVQTGDADTLLCFSDDSFSRHEYDVTLSSLMLYPRCCGRGPACPALKKLAGLSSDQLSLLERATAAVPKRKLASEKETRIQKLIEKTGTMKQR